VKDENGSITVIKSDIIISYSCHFGVTIQIPSGGTAEELHQ